MTYYCEPAQDLPAAWKPKRIIFYRQGIKIYGAIPYLLQRRLHAEFISNNVGSIRGARIIAPTGEANYTLVRYHRENGRPHSEPALQALLDWLYADKGFEWSIAAPEHWRDRLDQPNWWQSPPRTFVPAEATEAMKFMGWLLAGPPE